ncbi:UBC-like protein [Clavulina sp. PMI_390]|nr:UBC-like protein [Clavulina sp. PMI_390]
MASIASRRLTKELQGLKAGCPAGISLIQADDLETWIMGLEVLGESIYKGEVFALKFKFGPRYPIDSPEVTFVVSDQYKPPVHAHSYTNGFICMSILGNEWSPVLNVESVCISIQSMLASAKEKVLPEGNDRFVKTAPLSPKNARFIYDGM